MNNGEIGLYQAIVTYKDRHNPSAYHIHKEPPKSLSGAKGFVVSAYQCGFFVNNGDALDFIEPSRFVKAKIVPQK